MRLVLPGKIDGYLDAPPSKSMMQRVVVVATLAKGKTTVLNPSFSDDCLAALDAAKVLGAEIKIEKDKVVIEGGQHEVGGVRNKINCRESGLCSRMLIPIAATFGKEITITGQGSLLKRPFDMVEKPLHQLGVEVKTNGGKLPVIVKGPIAGGKKVEVDGSVSSQFITGLLMALPLAKEDTQLVVKNLRSSMYVTLTRSVLCDFGVRISPNDGPIRGRQQYRPINKYAIDGDWSGAAFLLVAGAIAGKINVQNLDNTSLQPDVSILDALKKTGAKVRVGKKFVEVEKKELNNFEFDATDCPDLFPSLVVLAANCHGVSKIKGVEKLKYKESDRGVALKKEFEKLGIMIEIDGNCDLMKVHGGRIVGGKVDSHNDHRIAMAAAIAALNSERGIEIEDEECVKKSYPNFFDDLELIKSRLKSQKGE